MNGLGLSLSSSIPAHDIAARKDPPIFSGRKKAIIENASLVPHSSWLNLLDIDNVGRIITGVTGRAV
jgi:hypothetical protein